MPNDLLADALERAERSDPAVRAAALLRIARVETVFDPIAARGTFERGLDATRLIPGREGEFLLEQARFVAAAVAPELLSGIGGNRLIHMSADRLVQIMIAHGHTDEAIAYLMRNREGKFPFGMVPAVLHHAPDETVRLTLLRRAIEAWRNTPYDPGNPYHNDFIGMFQSQWQALPREEALTVAREIVAVTHDQPELPISATYADGAIRITSRRAHNLFSILDALRDLDPPLAEPLIHKHKQLAHAASRFPNGLRSIQDEEEARRRATPRTTEGGYGMLGSPDDFPYLKSLIQATRDGDFGPPLEHAIERYREDTDRSRPNRAPRECWPSTEALRSILYSAGKRLGRDAAIYLDRIPDADLRLFAQIELAAALAGLPELQGLQMESRH